MNTQASATPGATTHLLATTAVDGRTGVVHHDAWPERAGQALRDRPSDQPYTVLMIDLDRLEDVNDTWGHLAGDAVVAAAAPIPA